MVERPARNLIAYSKIDANVTDATRFAVLLNEAEQDWLEIANYAAMSGATGWQQVYDDGTTAFYTWSKPSSGTAFGSVGTTVNSTLTAPDSASAVEADKLPQKLS